MTHMTQGQDGSGPLSFLAGLAFGGLVGAGTALLLAPRSGEETRRRLLDEAENAREQVAQSVDEARAGAEKAVQDVTSKVNQLQARGRELVTRNKRRVEETAAAVTAAAKEAWAPNGAEPAPRPTAG